MIFTRAGMNALACSRSQRVSFDPQGISNWCSPASSLGSFPINTRGYVDGLHSSVPPEICYYHAAWNSNSRINNMFSTSGEPGVVLHVYYTAMKTKSIMYCLSCLFALYSFVILLEFKVLFFM